MFRVLCQKSLYARVSDNSSGISLKSVGITGSGFNEWELRKFKDLFKDAASQSKVYDAAVEEPYTPARLKTKVLVKYYQITEQSSVFRSPIFERST